jgi:hypothetical protein
MVKDFYQAVDVAAGGWIAVPLGDQLDGQAVNNASGVACEVSFDAGVTSLALRATGPTSALTWESHARSTVWVKRSAGTGGGPLIVDVYGWRELR